MVTFPQKVTGCGQSPRNPFARRARTIDEKGGAPFWSALNTVLLRKTVALARVLCLRLMVMGFAPETPSGGGEAPAGTSRVAAGQENKVLCPRLWFEQKIKLLCPLTPRFFEKNRVKLYFCPAYSYRQRVKLYFYSQLSTRSQYTT